MSTPTMYGFYLRSEFAKARNQPVVVLRDEVRFFAENSVEAINSDARLTFSEMDRLEEQYLHRLESGTSYVFGRSAVLGPLGSRS